MSPHASRNVLLQSCKLWFLFYWEHSAVFGFLPGAAVVSIHRLLNSKGKHFVVFFLLAARPTLLNYQLVRTYSLCGMYCFLSLADRLAKLTFRCDEYAGTSSSRLLSNAAWEIVFKNLSCC